MFDRIHEKLTKIGLSIKICLLYQRGDPMATSKAAQKAVYKYEKENYDQVSAKFPKGTKDRIKSTGKTVNGYINEAVIEKLERDGK